MSNLNSPIINKNHSDIDQKNSDQKLESVLRQMIARIEYNEQKRPQEKKSRKTVIRDFLVQEDF